MVIHVATGVSKPHMAHNETIGVKSGSDKRKATSREEIQRMYQRVGLIHGDEIPADNLTVADPDMGDFKEFFEVHIGDLLDNQNTPLPIILENMHLRKVMC